MHKHSVWAGVGVFSYLRPKISAVGTDKSPTQVFELSMFPPWHFFSTPAVVRALTVSAHHAWSFGVLPWFSFAYEVINIAGQSKSSGYAQIDQSQ